MTSNALPLPTDYRRPTSATQGQKPVLFGVISDSIHRHKAVSGSSLPFEDSPVDPIWQFQDPKSVLIFEQGSVYLPYRDAASDIGVLNDPLINVIGTISTAPRRGQGISVGNVGDVFLVNATGGQPQYESTAVRWDETAGASISPASSLGSTSLTISSLSKRRRVYVDTNVVVDALITAIYSELPIHGNTALDEPRSPLPHHAAATRWLRETADLTASEIAEVFGVRRETVQRWIGGGPINRHHASALNFVEVIFREVVRRIGNDELKNWVRRPAISGAEEPQSPLDLLRAGRFDDVHRRVVQLPDSTGQIGDTELALHRPEYRDDD